MKCLFCNGNLFPQKALTHTGRPGFACMHCGRSSDLAYELRVIVEQMVEHTGNHTYGSSADYKYRRRMGLPPVGRKGRSGRRNKWG